MRGLNMKNITIIMSLSCLSLLAYSRNESHSYHGRNDCVEVITLTIKGEESLEANCTESEELKLDETYLNFPNLNQNPRRVNYWVGGYQRLKITKLTNLRQVIDVCRGRILDEREFEKTYTSTLYFKVYNPNLEISISESFMLSPLSERQAQIALNRSKKECELFNLK